MISETMFDSWPVWLLYPVTAVILLLGSQIGYRIGTWQRARRDENDKAPTNAIMGSTLGLLAFLLAFTFNMSNSRFDTRRQLVLEEASAILQAHELAQFLPETQREECSRLLREYVALRLEIPRLQSLDEIGKVVVRAEAVQQALWAQAASMAGSPNTILSSFIRSLSALTDLQMKRVRAAVWNRIPATIVLMLYSVAFLGVTTMGFGAGLVASRTILPTVVLVLAFSAIMTLIIDLERPRQTFFQVSHEPMAAVAARIGVTPTE